MKGQGGCGETRLQENRELEPSNRPDLIYSSLVRDAKQQVESAFGEILGRRQGYQKAGPKAHPSIKT